MAKLKKAEPAKRRGRRPAALDRLALDAAQLDGRQASGARSPAEQGSAPDTSRADSKLMVRVDQITGTARSIADHYKAASIEARGAAAVRLASLITQLHELIAE